MIPEEKDQMLVGTAVSALLIKVSKHLALLLSLLILGQASGRYQVGEISLFALALASSLLYALGRFLQDRVRRQAAPRGGPT
jgi:hypothetical protein